MRRDHPILPHWDVNPTYDFDAANLLLTYCIGDDTDPDEVIDIRARGDSALTRHCATKSARVGETDHQYHGRPQEGACRYRGVATNDAGPHPISDTGTERQTQQPAGAGPTVGNLGSAHHPRRNTVGYRHIARLACHDPGIDRAAPPPALHWMEGGRVLEKNLAARASVVLQMLSPL